MLRRLHLLGNSNPSLEGIECDARRGLRVTSVSRTSTNDRGPRSRFRSADALGFVPGRPNPSVGDETTGRDLPPLGGAETMADTSITRPLAIRGWLLSSQFHGRLSALSWLPVHKTCCANELAAPPPKNNPAASMNNVQEDVVCRSRPPTRYANRCTPKTPRRRRRRKIIMPVTRLAAKCGC